MGMGPNRALPSAKPPAAPSRTLRSRTAVATRPAIKRCPSASSVPSTDVGHEAKPKAAPRAASVSRIGAFGRSKNVHDDEAFDNNGSRISRPVPSQEDTPQNTVPSKMEALLSKFDTSHTKYILNCKRRANGVKEMRRHLGRSGVNAIIRESVVWDLSTTSLLLETLNSTKKWSLQDVGVLLPTLKDMLGSGQEVSVALESLHFICTSMLDYIKKSARPPGLTGVDVAADERREIATNCLKTLASLRDSRDDLLVTMNIDEATECDAILCLLRGI